MKLTLDEIKQKAVPILKNAGVKRLELFGSYVRGDNTEKSDIDFLVELPEHTTLLDLVGLEQDLEETLQKNVDVITYRSISPLIKDPLLSSVYTLL